MNQPQLGSFESIPLAAIRPSQTNPRKHFDPLALEELQRSIEEMGVSQPLLLRPLTTWRVVENDPSATEELPYLVTDGAKRRIRTDDLARANQIADEQNSAEMGAFEIVSGERRFRAAQAAGLDGVPAIVKELSDAEALDIQMIENLQRQDLHPVEEAEGYRALMAAGATAEDVAKKAGKSLAYVKQRIALLGLEVDAKQLFADGHLTLDHALLLARLTPKDQERAVLHLVGLRDWEMKKELTLGENIAKKFETSSYDWMEAKQREEHLARDAAKRKIHVTAGELKLWIQANVLLQLATAPWDLADAELLPAAGPCTTCPKRTGANAALFADITAAEDVCTDPACFSAKQAAYAARELERAKESGSPLLKLSSKRSHDKLEAPVVELKPSAVKLEGAKAVETKRPVVVTKKAIKEGQWVPSSEGACPKTVQGVVTDGPQRGTMQWVCPDQNCKVHKHQVDRPRTVSAGASGQNSPANAAAAELARKQQERLRTALQAQLEAQNPQSGHMLEYFMAGYARNNWNGSLLDLCDIFDIAVPGHKKGDAKGKQTWQIGTAKLDAAEAALENFLREATTPEFQDVAMALVLGDIEPWDGNDELVLVAKRFGIDVDGIVTKIADELKAEAEAATIRAEADKPAKPKLTAAEQKKRKAAAKKQFGKPAKKSAPKLDGKSAGAGAGKEQAGA